MQLRALEDRKTHSTYLYSLILSCYVNTPEGKFSLDVMKQHLQYMYDIPFN